MPRIDHSRETRRTMDTRHIAYRYLLLRAEMQRRLTPAGKWAGVPGLLDELHALRDQYAAAKRGGSALVAERSRP